MTCETKQGSFMKDIPAFGNDGKFKDRHVTATGEPRARVALSDPKTLWFNTGSLCNIECANCYIESSPSNDRLVYLSADDVSGYLDQIETRKWPVEEIAFTGGEPFMNPEMIGMARAALQRGFSVLILTNAMRPMMRRKMQTGLQELNAAYPGKMVLRISVDYYHREPHDRERGEGSFAMTMRGMEWLRDNQIKMAVAGRIIWAENEAEARAGFAELFKINNFQIDAYDPVDMVLFPEMDVNVEVPEITTGCWDILGKSPGSVMCSSSRMVVKRKGAAGPSVLACTLLPYAPEFELGSSLKEAEQDVYLNHPHCAKFCVLGGASCSS